MGCKLTCLGISFVHKVGVAIGVGIQILEKYLSKCLSLSLFLSPPPHVGFDDLNVCADPGVPENGFRTPSGGVFFESSVTRFHCQDGFRLKGSTKRLCMKHFNGTLGWVPSDKPVCIQEGKGPTPLWKPATWLSGMKTVVFLEGSPRAGLVDKISLNHSVSLSVTIQSITILVGSRTHSDPRGQFPTGRPGQHPLSEEYSKYFCAEGGCDLDSNLLAQCLV